MWFFMSQKSSDMLEHMNIKKLLITLSIPATLGMMVNALYNLVDAFFVSQGAGQIALGALILAFPVQMVITAVGIMIGIGSASVFSRAFGRKDYDTMKTAVNTALRLDLLIAGLISIFGYIFIDDLLVLFAASESNVGYAKDYLGVILLGLVPLSLTIVMNNLARAEGRPKIAMVTMMIGAGLNILLDPIFIFDFGLGLGVKGAAMATVISQSIAFIYALLNALSAKSFKIISYGFLFLGLQVMLSSLYQSLGYPIKALIVATSRQFWLFLPIALIMTSFFELDGIWMTFALSDIIAGVISFVMLRYELKIFKKKHIEQQKMKQELDL
jgi:Na+-driven multidrug efflux pump